ncbi:DivIVA domain-containing protein [Citricoccus muralis]|uniref:Cell wall synthesis protein Wag31 n=1 Tax=Citricoccus muralis TaxID=169134 RepID=A0ABY8H3A6_9MICC|nr:DivIVA domain-containing protein [Citricoccus muralis]WFP15496.1 DivIVA domain-containing protein [Citricoccus muralis]
MALTPEDVVNKRFQATKFREGYDQDEVDDFLDEIVVELRRLNQENDELRRKVSELQSGDGADAAVPAPVSADGQSGETAAEEDPTEPEAEEEVVVEETEEVVAETTQPAPVTAAAPAAAPAAEAAHSGDANSAAGVLAMAQRLHDEYVAQGEAKRDQIIAEAKIEADSLVTDAQEKSRKILTELEKKKSVLERQVEELRGFERDYRSRLKSFIEGQLQDLDSQAQIVDQ